MDEKNVVYRYFCRLFQTYMKLLNVFANIGHQMLILLYDEMHRCHAGTPLSMFVQDLSQPADDRVLDAVPTVMGRDQCFFAIQQSRHRCTGDGLLACMQAILAAVGSNPVG